MDRVFYFHKCNVAVPQINKIANADVFKRQNCILSRVDLYGMCRCPNVGSHMSCVPTCAGIMKRKSLIPLGDALLEISLYTLLRRAAAPQTLQTWSFILFYFPVECRRLSTAFIGVPLKCRSQQGERALTGAAQCPVL